MTAARSTNPFLTRRGRPLLVRCAVLFVDLLGVREMNMSPRVAGHLVALHDAVSVMHRDFFGEPSRYRSAFFSDTLVLAAPIVRETDDATEVESLVRHARWLQSNLLAEAFFIRGGLSLGSLHVSDHVLFGPALVEAYDLESRAAVHPRIVLSRAAAETQRGTAGGSMLLCDDDGQTFIDYLGPRSTSPTIPSLFCRAIETPSLVAFMAPGVTSAAGRSIGGSASTTMRWFGGGSRRRETSCSSSRRP